MKLTIRKSMLSQTRSKSEKELAELSVQVCAELEKNKHFQDAKIVLCFWSLPDEVHTHDFIQKWSNEKTFLLPEVIGEKLVLHTFTDIESMKVGKFGIGEPTSDVFSDYSKIDLCIIPGLAFDKEGGRMGRGKGFYDRFLPQTNCYKIGICFPWQIVPKIDCAPWDIPMDEVVSCEL
ncbi:MAG: 5-formyltetrahydrofolate cyclo-ligase [Bacteroidales bacterium]|nr:5-formyltetrahydrofolate cyclo-ligase [Bacteroidales bacterium]MBP5724089.1 5-formyltetrahydrofolate cyclo-ligase [Bacteroidales bacterium]MBR4690129.1 5-formyltetrahydrofolate cyclo-ligase [Bacteroidales bacterium]